MYGCSSSTDSDSQEPPAITKHSLKAEVDPEGAGSVSPASGEFDKGTEIELKATASEHWAFAGWDGDVKGNDNPIKVAVTKDLYVQALFEKMKYSLSVDVDGEGEVEEKLVPAKSYEHGATVELTAKPAAGWTFKKWQGDLSGDENPASVSVDKDKEITAVFEINTYTVLVDTNGEGSVKLDPDKKSYQHGEEVKLTATRQPGWRFTKWTGDVKSDKNPVTVEVKKDLSITANFEECNDPAECITSLFYASTIVGNIVFNSDLQLRNELSSDIILKSVTVKRGNGNIAAADMNINETLEPGDVKKLNAKYLPQPETDEFLEFTAEWVFDYKGVEYTIISNARLITI